MKITGHIFLGETKNRNYRCASIKSRSLQLNVFWKTKVRRQTIEDTQFYAYVKQLKMNEFIYDAM